MDLTQLQDELRQHLNTLLQKPGVAAAHVCDTHDPYARAAQAAPSNPIQVITSEHRYMAQQIGDSGFYLVIGIVKSHPVVKSFARMFRKTHSRALRAVNCRPATPMPPAEGPSQHGNTAQVRVLHTL